MRRDPAWMIRKFCNEDPWALQQRIMESVRDNPRTAVKSCHSSGKSFTAARIAFWFLISFEESIVVTTAPSHRQVEKIIWPEIRRAAKKARARGFQVPGRILTTEWKIDDKWYAVGFSTDDPDRFQGLHAKNVLVIVDEASGIKPEIWEAIEAIMASGAMVRLLTIGNPTDPTGPWADEFKSLPAHAKFTISAFDTPNFTTFGITPADIVSGAWEKKIGRGKIPHPQLISPAWVADKAKRWGTESPMWAARVLGEFPASAPDALIPLSWIEAAQRAWSEVKIGHPLAREPIELGVDVARMGSNKTVIYERRGIRVQCLSRTNQEPTTATTGRVIDKMRSSRATIAKVDGAGVGGGVVDQLAEKNIPVADMQPGQAASDGERFFNARAEWYWGLRERFEAAYTEGIVAGSIAINPAEDELAWQLAAIKYKIDPRGRTQIESKDDMSARGVPSPDDADAVMMACAEPGVAPVPMVAPIGIPNESDWNV